MKFFDFPALSKLQLIGLFVLKIIAGMAVYAIYTYYYSGSDFFLFFKSSKVVFDHFLGNNLSVPTPGWQASFDSDIYNNARVIIYINFVFQFFSFNNIFVHILFFCFISFVGTTALYKAFYKHFPDKSFLLTLGLFLVPSVLFWTAGIYKETVALCCLGFILLFTDFGLTKSISLKKAVCLVFLCVLLFFIKIYIAAALLPLLLINQLVSRLGNKRFLIKYFLIFVSFVIIFHLVFKANDKINVYQLIADKQAKAISESEGGIFLANNAHFIRIDYVDEATLILQSDSIYKIKAGSRYLSWKLDNMKDTTFVNNSTDTALYKLCYKIQPVNSVIQLKKANASLIDILKEMPRAIINVFVQPTLFSIKNSLQLISWIENMWLLLLVVLAILFFDKKLILKKEILLFCLLFALIQFAMIGLTTPSVGAMVRYKTTALPFLFVLALLCIDGEKLLKKLKRTKN